MQLFLKKISASLKKQQFQLAVNQAYIATISYSSLYLLLPCPIPTLTFVRGSIAKV